MKKNTTRRDALRQAIWRDERTQAEVAHDADMTGPVLSEIIHGKRNPTDVQVAALCRVLGLSARKLGFAKGGA
jgi:hypothetical protein